MSDVLNAMLIQAFVAFTRIAGCFMLFPGFASVRVPQQVRIVFALVLTITLIPVLPMKPENWSSLGAAPLARILFVETVIGAVLGLSARFYIFAVGFTVTAASSVIGYNSLVAPSIIESDMEPALGSMMSFAALLVIFAMDFHHDVIRALVDSYAVVPIGASLSFGAIASDLVRVLSDSFLITIRLGSPFLAYALIANLFVALLNKLTPNLQLYFVATPAVLFGGLIVVYFVLPAFLSFVGLGLQTLGPFR